MQAKDLKSEVENAIKTSTLPLNNHGVCSMIQVGNTQMKKSHLVENVIFTGQILAKKYPGNWKNIRSLHLKAEKSLSVPIHINLGRKNTLFNGMNVISNDFPFQNQQTMLDSLTL